MRNTYRHDSALALQTEKQRAPLTMSLEVKGRCPICGQGRTSKLHGSRCAVENKRRAEL